MKTVLITGANRGIGLEFARQYMQDGWYVLATARKPEAAKQLEGLAGPGKLEVLQLDLSQPDGFDAFRKQVENLTDKVDLLINNAGLYPEKSRSDQLTADALMRAFETNTVGTLMLTRTLVPLLEKAEGVVVNISSTMGSIDSKRGEGPGADYAYSISKAALNMGTLLLANDLKPKRITVVAQCPGWVQTDMGGQNAQLKPEDSVGAMRRTFEGLNLEVTGRFQNRFGDPIAD